MIMLYSPIAQVPTLELEQPSNPLLLNFEAGKHDKVRFIVRCCGTLRHPGGGEVETGPSEECTLHSGIFDPR